MRVSGGEDCGAMSTQPKKRTPKFQSTGPSGSGNAGGVPAAAAATPSPAAGGASLEEKLNALNDQIVADNVQQWADAHGEEVPEHLRAKGGTGARDCADMYMGGADVSALSAAVFQKKRTSVERRLLSRWLDGIGPMRVMGSAVENQGLLYKDCRDVCVDRMATVVAQQGEDIIRKGEQNRSIYIVVSGAAELMVPPAMSEIVDAEAQNKNMDKVVIKLLGASDVPTDVRVRFPAPHLILSRLSAPLSESLSALSFAA
jgi:hypothetical protein